MLLFICFERCFSDIFFVGVFVGMIILDVRECVMICLFEILYLGSFSMGGVRISMIGSRLVSISIVISSGYYFGVGLCSGVN